MSVQNKWDQFVANTNVGLFYLLMKTLKFLVAIWCTKAVHWLFSELCGYGACFCAASVLHYRSACCQCISWSMHTCLGPPPDVLNWVTREASGGDDTIFHVKLLKRCTKTNNCRRALFVFPFEVLPCHSRLDDPLLWITSSEKMWMKKRGFMCVYIYWGHQINPSFILLTFEWLEKCCTVHQCLLYSLISTHQKGQIFLEWNLDFMQIVPVFFFCN